MNKSLDWTSRPGPGGIRTVQVYVPTAQWVTLCFFVGAGAVYETRREHGLSHFIEHMLFKGTQTRGAADISEAIDAVGGQMNAYTAKENTCFYIRVLPEFLPMAFDLLTDMLLHARLDEEDIAREQRVVQEEIAMVEDTPDDIAHEALTAACFAGHPLSREILGTRKTVGSFTAQDIRAYMQKRYGAGSLVISISGQFERDRFEALCEQYCSQWAPSPALRRPGMHTVAPGDQPLFIHKPIEQVHACLGYPGLPLGDSDTYALMTLHNAFGGGMSSRLFRILREERGMCYSVYSYPAFYVQGGMVTLYVGTSPDQAGDAIALMRDEAQKLAAHGLNREEYQRAYNQMRGNYLLGQESVQAQAQAAGRGILLLGRAPKPEEILKKMQAVTFERVNELARLIFSVSPHEVRVGTKDKI